MSLKVWLPLDGNVIDSGLLNLKGQIMGSPEWPNGKIGKCLYAGTGATTERGISYPTNLVTELGNEFSISVWVCPKGTHLHYNGTIASSGNWNTSCWSFGVSQDNSQVDIFSKGYNNYIACPVPVNVWTHLTCTQKNGIIKLYKNGVYVGEKSNQSATLSSDANNFCIGRETYASGYFSFNGLINDVRIYDHCLSMREIKENAKGLILHYQLKNKMPATNLVKNATYSIYNNHGVPATLTKLSTTYQGCSIYRLTMTPTAATQASFRTELWSHGVYGFSRTFKANTKYCFWMYYRPVTHNDIRVGGTASNIGGWTEISPHYYQDGWYRVGQSRSGSVTADKSDSIFTSFYSPTATADVPISIDFCCPHLIEGSSSIIEEDGYLYDSYDSREPDVSGYSRHGTLSTKFTYDSNSPRYSGCYSVGTGYITAPTLATAGFANSYTISWWSKNADMNGKMAWGFQDGNRLNLYPSSAFCWNTTDGSSNPFQKDGSNVGFTTYNGAWHHYAVTGNGSTTTLYIDGAVKGTAKTYRPLTGSQIVLSGWSTTDNNYRWNGQLSDYRIYATCLSAQDIKDLFNAPIEIDNAGNIYALDYNEI